EISRPVRAVLSVLPLIVAQALCVFAVLKRKESRAWRESVAVANTCALAAAIGLIGQTYNIPGDIGSFLLALALLNLPVSYLLWSGWYLVLFLAAAGCWRWLEDASLLIWARLLLPLPAAWAMSRRAETRAPLLALLVSAVFCLPLDANDFVWPILIWSL